MAAPIKHVLSVIHRPQYWPTVLRADVYVRAQRYLQPRKRLVHRVVTFDGGVNAADCERWGVRVAEVRTAESLVDASQILIDRLLRAGRAYTAGERIFFRWAGCPGYQRPIRMFDRQQPTDIQLWGPHWPGGPVGPSRAALRQAAIFELAGGAVERIFGFTPADANTQQLIAMGSTIETIEPGLGAARPLNSDPMHTRWRPAELRWAAMQVRQALAPANGGVAAARAHAARHGQRMRSLADDPPEPEHLSMIERAEAALTQCDWHEASDWLFRLAKSIARMGHRDDGGSRRARNLVMALLDTLGL